MSGTGAALTESYRWNSPHTYLVYTSATRALATLEVSVHLELSEDLPTDRFYVEIEIPDEVEILELRATDLPENWGSYPPILETQYIGDDFVMENMAAVLKVPSSIVPPEFNFLINPNHPKAKKINLVSVVPLRFGQRFKEIRKK